jgi:hypothetical protein
MTGWQARKDWARHRPSTNGSRTMMTSILNSLVVFTAWGTPEGMSTGC